jgi:3-oxoacyl-[acyl-carrier protein] reductase
VTWSSDRLSGKVAIVTGAASGIGRASAERLAAEGARVVIADIRGDAAEETAKALAGETIGVEVDVSDPGSVEAMVRAATDAFGGLDILHSNAAVPQAVVPFTELPLDVWRRTVDVNLTGAFLCVQAAVPAMRERAGGAIVITSSVSAVRPRPGISAYVASKSGVIGFARSVALDLAPEGIRVNVVLPGPVESPFLEGMSLTGGGAVDTDAIAAGIPQGKLIEPASLAAAVAYLVGDDAAQVTGSVLNVDGGRGL